MKVLNEIIAIFEKKKVKISEKTLASFGRTLSHSLTSLESSTHDNMVNLIYRPNATTTTTDFTSFLVVLF